MIDAFGPLEWSPEQFWRSTLTEFVLAVEGFSKKNGEDKVAAPTDDAMDALAARYG